MPEDVKEDIEVEFEEVDVEVETSKSDELKEKAEKFREDFRTKAEARNEANKEKFDETLNKSKDVAGKVGENLSKTIDDTIIAMKALQKNFDTRYQGYKETVATGNIAESKDFYYLQAYLAGIEKEDISIEATNNSVTIKTCFDNIMKNIESTEEDPATLIVSGIKVGEADRTVTLTEDIVKEEITAKHNNGTLFVTIPKRIVPKTKIDIE